MRLLQRKQLPPALNACAAEDATIHLARENAVGKGRVKRTALIQRLKLFRGEVNLQRVQVVMQLLKLAGTQDGRGDTRQR